jgi:hypothetical protein
MDITQTTITEALNAILNASETTTTLARATRAGLRWVSEQGKWSCLHEQSPSYSLTRGVNSMVWPDNFRKLDMIRLHDGTQDLPPLERTTFKGLERFGSYASQYGQPTKFVQREKKFELNKMCDVSYTALVWYWRYHPDQAEILFGEEFEQAVNYAVISAYLEERGRHAKAQYYRRLAADALPAGDAEDKKERITKYRDLG